MIEIAERENSKVEAAKGRQQREDSKGETARWTLHDGRLNENTTLGDTQWWQGNGDNVER